MELMREVVESFIRLVKAEIHPNAVLVSSDDIFEVTQTPSCILQGPSVSESVEKVAQVHMASLLTMTFIIAKYIQVSLLLTVSS